jgi:hypothetical protein
MMMVIWKLMTGFMEVKLVSMKVMLDLYVGGAGFPKLILVSVWMMMYFYKLMQVFGTADAGSFWLHLCTLCNDTGFEEADDDF